MVDITLWRVQVFSFLLFFLGEDTPTETQYTSAHGENGEHHSPSETVYLTIIVLYNCQPCFF